MAILPREVFPLQPDKNRIAGAVGQQPPDNTLIIRDAKSLRGWRRQLRRVILSRNLPVVQFELQRYSDLQNQTLSALAEDYRKACGCASGGFFMSVTVVATVTSYFIAGGRLSGITIGDIVSLVGIIVLVTAFGKSVGLLWARWRLLRLATNACQVVGRDP